jgi:uncharacterized membrane protein
MSEQKIGEKSLFCLAPIFLGGLMIGLGFGVLIMGALDTQSVYIPIFGLSILVAGSVLSQIWVSNQRKHDQH